MTARRRLFRLAALSALCACSSRGGNPTGGSGNPADYPWSLNLTFESEYDSIGPQTTIATQAEGIATGSIHPFDASILGDSIFFAIQGIPNFRFAVPVQATGAFAFAGDSLFGTLTGSMQLRVFFRPPNAAYRPAPETAQVAVNRYQVFPWALDLTWPGGISLQQIRADTSATDTAGGAVSGRVDDYVSSVFVDSIFVSNRTHPGFSTSAALDTAGAFQFAEANVTGSFRGPQRLAIWVHSKVAGIRPDPDTVRFTLTR